ncbi:MAG: hypothetical protein MJ016_02475 [Victivallaceae bacterium]|nr:hypothetical protein [Victivallaceae bacterium]
MTQLICAMQGKKIGHPVAGPMVGALSCLNENCLQEMADIHHGRAIGPVALTPLTPGDCRGLPLTGHLERLCRVWKSSCPPDPRGRIVFIEYVNGSPEKTRQLLQELLDGGFFRDAAGVVFGQFVRCGEDAEIQKILTEFAPQTGLPVYCGFPFGHTQNCYTIDFARPCEISGNALTFPAVQ